MTAPSCLGVAKPLRILTTIHTDAAGEAVVTLPVPARVPPGPRFLQLAGPGLVSDVVPIWPTHPGSVRRGTWMWRDTGDPNGAGAVVGDPAAEARTVASMTAWSVDRVYGSYDYTHPTWLTDERDWHARLHAAGISVQLLLSENTWIDPATWPSLDGLLQHRLVDLHAAVPAQGRFDGVHLDVEPHGLPDWGQITGAQRRDRLNALRDLFAHVRQWMDAHGEAGTPLYADLPVWYDSIPGSIGWTSPAERDQWFVDLSASLAGISLMAYERPLSIRVLDGVDWERAHFAGEVRTALEVSVGPSATWPTFQAMLVTLGEVEAALGGGVDVHAWSSLAATSASLGGP